MKLRTIRNQKNMTQEQLEAASGVDQRTISKIELGLIKRPAWEIVARLARALNVHPEELFPVETKSA
jgi:transcriptional regulator with XRE-family HTH domain